MPKNGRDLAPHGLKLSRPQVAAQRPALLEKEPAGPVSPQQMAGAIVQPAFGINVQRLL